MSLFQHSESIVVVDFETTGMSPDKGDRAIEIGAVLVQDNKIVDSFQSLINPQFLVTREIESITGITNPMLADAPCADEIMDDFIKFIGTYPLVAHNASFDQKFLLSELAHFGKKRPLNFGCTLQVARRLYPDVINYKLETLVHYKNIAATGQFHRALADAEMTAALWNKLIEDLLSRFGFEHVPFELMKKIGKMNRENALELIRKEAEEMRSQQVDTTGSLFG